MLGYLAAIGAWDVLGSILEPVIIREPLWLSGVRIVAETVRESSGRTPDIACRFLPSDDDFDWGVFPILWAKGCSVAYQIINDEDEAIVAVMMAFERIARTSVLPINLEAYFIATVRACAYDLLRRRSVRKRFDGGSVDHFPDGASDFPAADPSPADVILNQELFSIVREAVVKLPQKHRLVIEHFYFQEYSIPEIAKRLKLPQGTIKRWLSEARAILRYHLRRDGVTAPV